MKDGVCVIIPAYNEEHVIAGVVEGVRRAGYHDVIVIDDGSADRTALYARKAGAVCLRHILNRGKGAAIRTGIEAAIRRRAGIIVTFDGDGQHDPHDIERLVSPLRRGYDVSLGSRSRNRDSMPKIRRIANTLGNAVTWGLYGVRVTDSQCGLRAYTRRACERFGTLNDRYEYDTEVIREIAHYRMKYIEVPVTVRYTRYSLKKKDRQSFVNGLRTLLKLLIS